MSLESINNELQKTAIQSPDQQKKEDLTRLKKVCADFESIFVAKVLRSMRQSIGESALFGDGLGADIYQDLFEAKLSESVAQSSPIGIGHALYKVLAERLNSNDDMENAKPLSLQKMTIQTPLDGQSANQTILQRIKNYHTTIQQAAEKFNLPLYLIYGVIAQESAGQPDVVSKAGAKGLMQLMDETASELGVKNSFDPTENIHGGIKYLRQQLDHFDGNVSLALAAYNAGPANVEKYNGSPPFQETQEYVRKVLRYASDFSQEFTVAEDI